MNVGDVHLDDRCLHGEECVKNRDGRCGEPGGIQDQPGSFFRPGLLNPVDDLTLVIGLPELDREAEALRRPEAREAQRVLAVECTTIVHGQDAVRSVEAATRILFSASDEAPTPDTIALLAREVPVTDLPQTELAAGIPLVDLMVRTKLAESKGSARKLIEGGGVYLNNERQVQTAKITTDHLKWPGAILLRTGKKNYHLVRIG